MAADDVGHLGEEPPGQVEVEVAAAPVYLGEAVQAVEGPASVQGGRQHKHALVRRLPGR